jgi:hypothetical protein
MNYQKSNGTPAGAAETPSANVAFNLTKLFICLLAGFVLGAWAPIASAQNTNTGEIRGEVHDASGALIPGVQVVIKNVNTGISQTKETSADGVYDAPFVPLGTYSITFSKVGFKTAVRTGVRVDVGISTVDATLEVGQVTTSVTVETQVATVETQSSDRSTVVSNFAVANLPNIGQDWTNTTALLPGIARAGPPYSTAAPVLGAGGYLSFDGAMPWQQNWLVDGGIATYPHSGNMAMAYDMPVETVQEVSTVTNNFAAQYTSGTSNFNVITRGGTNQFHGSLFEFVQNDKLQARNFFTLPTAANPLAKVSPLRWNKFGGNVGGPIKRDKAFFFFSYMSNPIAKSAPSLYTFPTAQARQGNFSASGYPTIYDPSTTTVVNGSTVRTPFPGNVITSTLDPVAQNIQSFFPIPNLSGLVNNYYAAPVYAWHQWWLIPKFDYNFSDKHRLSFSGTRENGGVTNNGVVPVATMLQEQKAGGGNSDQRYVLSDNYVFSPTLVGEFHSSMDRWVAIQFGWAAGKGYPAQLGLLNAPADNFPTVTITGALPVSLSGNRGSILIEGTYSQSAVLSLNRGRHFVRFGGEYNKPYTATNNARADAGSFTFGGVATRNPAVSGSTGLGYADFLLGQVQTWSATEYPLAEVRSWSSGLFLQDDFKITPTLTLNFGVRYTLQAGWFERLNRIGDFDPDLINPATKTPGAVWFANGTVTAGRRSEEDGAFNNWAPRLGFAWSPKKDWSIRGAYGIFDLPWGDGNYLSGAAVGMGNSAVGSQTSSDLITPIFQLKNGEPNLLYPDTSKLTPSFLNGQSIYYFPRHSAMPYMQQAHFDVQHQFAGFVLDAAYVWTKGTHLYFATDMNQVPANLLGPGNAQAMRPYPQFLNIPATEHGGLSKYNSLQVTLRRQFSRRFTLISNYTWAKSLDTGTGTGWNLGIDIWQIAQKPKANYGLSQYDIRQTFNGGVVYELPVGKGHSFLNQGGVANAIVGGWQVSALYDLHTGTPLTPVMASNLSGAMTGSWFPNRVGSGKLANPTRLAWYGTSAFVQPTSYTFGNSGRNVVTTPGYSGVDISLSKSFAVPWLGERSRFTIRADAQNATNHTNFGSPGSSIGSATAGTITSAYPARDIQLGAKLVF